MLALVLYAIGLSSPLLLFALICYIDDRKRGLARAPAVPKRCRAASQLEIDAHTAVLEAQYAVAPASAIRELREQLLSLGVSANTGSLESDQECFDRLLDRLSKIERRRHLLPV